MHRASNILRSQTINLIDQKNLGQVLLYNCIQEILTMDYQYTVHDAAGAAVDAQNNTVNELV